MDEPFKIAIPKHLHMANGMASILHVNNCRVVPYISFVEVAEEVATSDAHGTVQEWVREGNSAARLTFPGKSWRKLNSEISNPKYKIAITFVAGKNCLKVLDIVSGADMFVINGQIYRRLSWVTVGIKGRQTGMVAKKNCKDKKNFSYFVEKCYVANTEPIRSVVIAGLEKMALK